MERFGRQAMNRGCPACGVRVLNSGKPACISQAYAALTTATVQRAVLRGTVEWQPIGLHLSHFRQGKLLFPQERKLQTDHNHLGLGFPCWLIFLRMSGQITHCFGSNYKCSQFEYNVHIPAISIMQVLKSFYDLCGIMRKSTEAMCSGFLISLLKII